MTRKVRDAYVELNHDREGNSYYEVSVFFEDQPELYFSAKTSVEAMNLAEKEVPEIIEQDIQFEFI